MNQTASEYLTAEYGETQRAIQLEFDWLESVLLNYKLRTLGYWTPHY